MLTPWEDFWKTFWDTPQLVILLIVVFADAITSYIFIKVQGIAEEANPIMNFLMDHLGVASALILKVGVAAISIYILIICCERSTMSCVNIKNISTILLVSYIFLYASLGQF
jgi:hypothetical protein